MNIAHIVQVQSFLQVAESLPKSPFSCRTYWSGTKSTSQNSVEFIQIKQCCINILLYLLIRAEFFLIIWEAALGSSRMSRHTVLYKVENLCVYRVLFLVSDTTLFQRVVPGRYDDKVWIYSGVENEMLDNDSQMFSHYSVSMYLGTEFTLPKKQKKKKAQLVLFEAYVVLGTECYDK